ncbi:DNA cytosine methyltransferase [Elizabethkingia anophelis]|uniref:DNA (cytosine-5-)-methyltransferase n=2 Tax=Elizabethkingia anophelis TaxID=1117645 RepID=A0A455ZFN6_9FLAO|nr:DNA cytosine methyltransferase [Elizabethkingia anophelis]ATC35588.1 DNA cytosine methyltransferase [Elizabethkingia anophelis R26]ATC39226.1 DNA cytosine methyltransferase [Elizabethkingia anophelis Ag1]ATC42907.1 DNA cytosine methyltransferase [Elizabethkingia anophelis]ATC46583.1 DNA cytosine methyltransferase [Elizabethkingia anophelis]ELR81189.1 site-specific DNA methylase [Elizabethkingia anophelis R26]
MNNRFIKISALAISLLYVDLFCGAGGTSTGVELAQVHGEKCAKVIACVNHDENAIASHSANHPDSLHFTEDIRTLELSPLVDYATKMRKEYPFAKLILWASLECTNFSKAKGGHVRSYGYNFDWRLLNSADFGAFTSRKRFFAQFNKPGLPIVWPEQTHAKVTGKSGGLFENQFKPWNAVKDVLDLEDEGVSIFGRKKDLVEATLDRIYHGLIKFVAGGKDQWLLKYNSTSKDGKHNPPSIEDPCPVVSTQNRLGVATVDFLTKYYSGKPEHKNITIEGPAGTIKTIDSHALVQPKFLTAYYGNGFASSIETPSPTVTTGDRFNIINPKFMCSYNYKDEPKDLNNPCPTVLTKDRFALVGTDFIDQQFGNSKPTSVNSVLGAITTNPKYAKVHTEWIMNTNFRNIGSSIHVPAPTITANRKWHYLMDAQYSRVGNSLDQPCFTLIARMDKTPPYLVDITQDANDLPDFIKVIDNVVVYEIYEDDSPMMKKIKEFMAHYGLKDIKMRMLKIQELKEIMGFPEDYKLIGTQAEQKKYIGNAVEVTMAKVLCEAIAYRLHNNRIAA